MKITRITRFISLLLVFTLIMVGCGPKKTGGQSPDGSPTIKWLTTGDTAAKAIKADDRIIEEINKRLGINLVVEIVPESNTEKINVAMASGEMPDIVTGAYGTSATDSWIRNEMVISLNDYFEDNPSLKNRLTEEYAWDARDGKYFGVPFITQFNTANTLIVMRGDWLEKLGLEYPKTLEEMKQVLYAFTKDDPDGNGKDDTFGYTGVKPGASGTPFDWVFFAYGLPYADYSIDENDNVIAWFEDESFVPSMEYIKELWDNGLVDTELMLNDNPKKEEKFYQGRAGSMSAPLFRHVSRHENNLKQLFPEAYITYGPAPKGESGSFGISKQGKGGMYTCITATCKAPDKAAKFIDFMLSDEGNDLLRLGIEGIHYTREDGKIVINEEERAKDAFAPNGWSHALAWGSFFWPLESSYLPESELMRERAIETIEIASESQVKNLIKYKTPIEIEKGGMLGDIFIQYFSDMLQGSLEIEEGAKQLSESWRKQGGEELLKEVNEIYKASK